MNQTDVCMALMGGGKTGIVNWCERDYTMPRLFHALDNPEKYFQINLTPLGRFGTLEFRPGSATLDVKRAARWFQFIIGFVHTFKNTAHSERFFDDDFKTDWEELISAQMEATLAELKKYMANNVEDDFYEYFAQDRPFEKEPDTGCVSLYQKQLFGIPI